LNYEQGNTFWGVIGLVSYCVLTFTYVALFNCFLDYGQFNEKSFKIYLYFRLYACVFYLSLGSYVVAVGSTTLNKDLYLLFVFINFGFLSQLYNEMIDQEKRMISNFTDDELDE
jgi:hypothetical protein